LILPINGEVSALLLSTPFNILKPRAQHCVMSVENITFNCLNYESYFQVSFSADDDNRQENYVTGIGAGKYNN